MGPAPHNKPDCLWCYLVYFKYAKTFRIQLPPVTDTVVPVKDTSAARPAPVYAFSVKLPDGTSLNAKKGGIEDQLLNFFNDPNSKPSRRFPYNFDLLVFNNGTAVINKESMTQIQNVALILKTFPKSQN